MEITKINDFLPRRHHVLVRDIAWICYLNAFALNQMSTGCEVVDKDIYTSIYILNVIFIYKYRERYIKTLFHKDVATEEESASYHRIDITRLNNPKSKQSYLCKLR